jgi:putative component of membrane protein insertase Oxa1/YidC/SpoIIIJ protein YidD
MVVPAKILFFFVVFLVPLSLPGESWSGETGYSVLAGDEEQEWGGLIDLYQRRLSVHDGARCVFSPTCSAFYEQAASSYGVFWGLVMTLERLLYRDHRWAGGAYALSGNGERLLDPVWHNYILDTEEYFRK